MMDGLDKEMMTMQVLGDWVANPEETSRMVLKDYQSELKRWELKFGLWFEPEMVNKDSDLVSCASRLDFTYTGKKCISWQISVCFRFFTQRSSRVYL